MPYLQYQRTSRRITSPANCRHLKADIRRLSAHHPRPLCRPWPNFATEPLRAPSTCRPKIAKGGMLPALPGRRGTRDRGPKLESPGPCGSVVDGGKVLAAERKGVVELIMGREETLRLTG